MGSLPDYMKSETQPTILRLYGSSDRFCSSDPDGTITQYTWDFGNGATGSGQSTSAFFSETGSYQVELLVRDNEGRTATTFRTINVFGGDCDPGSPTICIH